MDFDPVLEFLGRVTSIGYPTDEALALPDCSLERQKAATIGRLHLAAVLYFNSNDRFGCFDHKIDLGVRLGPIAG